tara:strand:+ start:633 stop:1028 length:396 start_codon:yes stop_codon:yes gene_type:complete
MNAQQRNQMYPDESYNSKERCEQRWVDDANVYGDISPEWQISLGNGKRLSRKWRACGGLTYVYDNNGQERAIYNENYDREWRQAIEDLRPPQGLTRCNAIRYADDDYDMSLQPDDDPDFYSYPIQRSYANY